MLAEYSMIPGCAQWMGREGLRVPHRYRQRGWDGRKWGDELCRVAMEFSLRTDKWTQAALNRMLPDLFGTRPAPPPRPTRDRRESPSEKGSTTTYWIEDAAAAVDVPWLFDELAQRGGVGFLAGASGSGKTFCAVHMAMCGAIGRPFFGRAAPQRFGTYIVAAEGSHSIPQRVRAAAVHSFGVPATEAQKLPIAYCKDVPNLLTKAGLEEFTADLRRAHDEMVSRYAVKLGLVLIDTFGQAFSLDDDKAAEVTRATKPMLAIAQSTGATVLATHHFGHAAQRMRGSTALRANADFVVEARKDGELFLEKCRDAAEIRLGWYELPIVDVGAKADGSPITSRYVRELAARQPRAGSPADGFTPVVLNSDFDNAFGSVAKVGQGGDLEASVPAVKHAFYSVRDGADATKRQAWKRARQKATAQGYLFDGDLISKRVTA